MNVRQQLVLTSLLVLSTGFFLRDLKVTGQTSRNQNRQTASPGAKDKEIKKLFKQNCAKCHGEDGAGETTAGEIAGVPDFTDQRWQELYDYQRLTNSIKHGRGEMPSFGKKFSKEQIKSFVSYVRAFKN